MTRSWCVVSEIDFDSTLVGGQNDLIDKVLRCDDLEAWSVGPLDSLACDGDMINQPRPRNDRIRRGPVVRGVS
jgi:hypothetical protein